MRCPINKRIYRQFKYKPLKVIPILIAITFIVIFASSFFTAQESVEKLYYKQIADGKVEDGEFETIYELSDEAKDEIKGLGIKLYENYYFEDEIDSGRVLRIFKTRKNINEEQIFEGSLPEKADEINISAYFARSSDIKMGDEITIQNKKFKVSSLASFPDYSSALRNRSDLVMDTGHFGIATISSESFDDMKDAHVKFLYSYHTDHDLDKKEAREKLKDIAKIVNKDNLMVDGVTRLDNKCITYVGDDMSGDVPTMSLVTALLFVAFAFISSVQIKSIIEDEAPIIGTLLASGYRKRELLFNYMAMPIFIVIIASIVGNAVSYLYAYKIYTNVYYQAYDLPSFVPYISARSFLITSVMPLVLYLVINYIIIARSLRMRPVDFLRKNFKKSGARSRLKLKNMNFVNKFKLRVLFTNKFSYISLLFGIFIANLLLIYGVSAEPMFTKYAEDMQNQMKYAHTYIVKSDVDDLDASKISLVSVELVDREDEDIQVYGLDEGTKYDKIDVSSLQSGDAVISLGLSKRFDYAIGDKIKIREPYNTEEKTILVKDIDDTNNYFQIFTKRENLNELIGKDKNYYNAYLSDEELNITKENLLTEIDREEMSKFMKHFLASFSAVFVMVQIAAIAFYFILLLIVTELIIEKAKLNMTYLKVFGYKDREVAKFYVNTSFAMLLLFQFLLIPILNKLIKYFYFISMQKFDAYIEVTVPLRVFVISYVMTIAVFALCQWIERRKISRIDMVKELKTIAG
ncbi:FtsX-like permease family protein [uncultured Fenollaria sp.]|uniref:FtsX-like permease family protein n=1 Tax=uncultured Fenollaria sp. TaxID=1686315 RepID=UPI0025D33D65|nr:ABC transporter permease [uncultured Fenollaria sp.]